MIECWRHAVDDAAAARFGHARALLMMYLVTAAHYHVSLNSRHLQVFNDCCLFHLHHESQLVTVSLLLAQVAIFLTVGNSYMLRTLNVEAFAKIVCFYQR